MFHYFIFYRVSCALITSDHKHVVAGTPDSVIYVWKRSNIPVISHKSSNPVDQTYEDFSKIGKLMKRTKVPLKNSQHYIEKLVL